MKVLKGERFGIVMIVATLLVITLIAGQFLLHRQKQHTSAIKEEGRNVVRLLANIPYQQLVSQQKHNSILDLLNRKQSDSDFAYAAIVNLSGHPLAFTTSGKVSIPPIDLSNKRNLWATEHEIPSQNNNKTLLEFRSPLLKAEELAGYIRIGYFKPNLELTEISFIAQLALPIFPLVPLTYLLIRRELKPLKQASIEINDAMQKQHIQSNKTDTADFQDFMLNFKSFVTQVDKKFAELNDQNFKEKASTLALTYKNQRTVSALQSLPDAILVMDETGKATFANSKLVPLIDKSLDQIIGFKHHEWCTNSPLNALLARYQGNSYRFQHSDSVEFHPKNNPALTILVNAYPLFSPKDTETISGTLVVFKDISTEIMASQARDQFINHVSHELKSPLNVIHMYAESLLETNIDEDQRIQSINVISDEIERLSNLINNLLNISKIEAGNIALNLQRVKLHEFLTDTFNSVARSGDHQDIQFNLELPRSLPNIQLDKDLIRVALNNLLTNAVKYNVEQGSVSFSAEETDDAIIIKITDTGIGIAEKDQQKVFEKFYRSDDDNVTQRNGHGLGLALAKEIIDIHQGQLSLQSTLGKGSVFTLILKKSSSFLKSREP